MRHQKRPEGELTPAPRIQINGISNMDTEEAGIQRIAVMIAEMYACGHSGTISTICSVTRLQTAETNIVTQVVTFS